MTWQDVARKDFKDAIRSKWLWALSVLFIGLFALPAALRFYFGIGRDPAQVDGVVTVFIWIMKEPVSLLVPIIAIVVAYSSITRERSSGTMKLLLSLPHSRSDVVFGKVVGRSAVVTAPILVGFLISFLVILPASTGFGLMSYVRFAFLTALLAIVFVGIAVAISAIASSDRRAMVGVVGTYLFAVFFWNQLGSAIADAARDYAGVEVGTRYLIELFIKLLNPIEAYKTLVDATVMTPIEARRQAFGFFLFADPDAIEALGEDLPLYFGDPFVIGYMLLWLVVPVAIGVWEFRQRDL